MPPKVEIIIMISEALRLNDTNSGLSYSEDEVGSAKVDTGWPRHLETNPASLPLVERSFSS